MPRLPEARRGYGKLGKALLWHIIALYYDHDISASKIAEHLNKDAVIKLVCARTISNLIKRFELTSDVRTPKTGLRRNNRRKITSEEWEYIIECYPSCPTFYLEEIQKLVLTNFGNRIPISTLVANLNREGWTRRVLQQRCISRNIALCLPYQNQPPTHTRNHGTTLKLWPQLLCIVVPQTTVSSPYVQTYTKGLGAYIYETYYLLENWSLTESSCRVNT